MYLSETCCITCRQLFNLALNINLYEMVYFYLSSNFRVSYNIIQAAEKLILLDFRLTIRASDPRNLEENCTNNRSSPPGG